MAKKGNQSPNPETTIYENGKRINAFVLRDGPQRVVYIPHRKLMRTEMQLLRNLSPIAQRKGEDLLETLNDNKAHNGRNALVQVQNLICHIPYEEAHGMTGNTQSNVEMTDSAMSEDFDNPVAEEAVSESSNSSTQTKKRGPGRPPKNKSTTTSSGLGVDS